MNIQILVIGANSMLAKATIPILSRAGASIVTAGKIGCDITCDITKRFSIPEGIDVVINFAAAFGGKDDDEISTAVKTNVEGILNICKASREARVGHLISVSSIFTELSSDSPFYSVYALTKKHSDELAQFYCNSNNIDLTIIKPSQIYGDDWGFSAHQPFLYKIIEQAQTGSDIELYGSNDPKRNYIHCLDVAEVIKRVIAHHTLGVYSCTSPTDITYGQIARAAQTIFQKGGKVVFLRDKPNIPDNIFTNEQLLFEKIDYYPQISVKDGMKRIKENVK